MALAAVLLLMAQQAGRAILPALSPVFREPSSVVIGRRALDVAGAAEAGFMADPTRVIAFSRRVLVLSQPRGIM
ncbi:MAG: hypothetical protein GTN78_23920 [Gemmatimonadales bacterium]|nr:hypothetical protein [Gemmatimonadales bacterium]